MKREMRSRDLQRALTALGPLEGRIMQEVWTRKVSEPFIVWDVVERMPELAYTTVMTTVQRLASKGLLAGTRVPGDRSVHYSVACTPAEYVRRFSRDQADELVELYGEAALAAFQDRLARLPPEQRRRLEELADR
jgi:predicted transcriptional regulator